MRLVATVEMLEFKLAMGELLDYDEYKSFPKISDRALRRRGPGTAPLPRLKANCILRLKLAQSSL